MGGVGSGRHWHYGAKEATNDYRHIDVRRWQKKGLLNLAQSFSWQWSRDGEVVGSIQVRSEVDHVILDYRYRSSGEEWKNERYPVQLDWTRCNLGGKRPWFRCPARRCGRRVAILYGGRIFACRHCYELAYPSQRESDYDRAARRADKIREKLGWEHGILNGEGLKPKGMHWRTFERLRWAHNSYVEQSLAGMALRYRIML